MIIENSIEDRERNFNVRYDALSIASRAIEDNLPSNTIDEFIHLTDNDIILGNNKYPLEEINNLYVLGAGKGSQRLVEAVTQKIENFVDTSVVVEKEGQSTASKSLTVLEAGHPLPNANSLEAGKTVVELLDNTTSDDLIIFCITGGTSSQLIYPDEIGLDDIITTTKLLLESGAPVSDLNTVRKHLSKIKGGKLAERGFPAQMVSLIIVDEIGRKPWGPTVPDQTTFDDAISVIRQNDCWDSLPESVQSHLKSGQQGKVAETPSELIDVPIQNVPISTADDLCTAASRAASDLGYDSMILSTYIEGEASDIGLAHGGLVKEIKKYKRPIEPPCAIISGGETTVTVDNPSGLGGPNQEAAIGFASNIEGLNGAVGIFLDSDGTDGPTNVAGAIVDGETATKAAEKERNLYDCLNNNNSTELLTSINEHIRFSGPGVNLMDLRIILVI